jgi:hypothetical protein
MRYPPVIFLKRPIFLPAAGSCKQVRRLAANGRVLVMMQRGAGGGAAQRQHPPFLQWNDLQSR